MIQPDLAALLTDSDAEYLCELITPKKIRLYFQKNPAALTGLKSGFRAKSLTDQQAITLIVKNRNRNFAAEFLNFFIEEYQKRVHDQIDSLKEVGVAADAALIQALAGSDAFSSHVELYFKLEGGSIPEEYIALIKAAVSLLCETAVESISKQSSDEGLLNSLEYTQHQLAEEREEHARMQAELVSGRLAVQQELEHVQDELSRAVSKIEKMQTELDHFQWLMEYADVPLENEGYEEYQYISLC